MVIQKLPDSVKNLIKAGFTVTNATHCVLELVYNALDAGATSIAVRVNLNKFYVQIVDNGCGMVYDDFQLIGENYVSSKCCDKEQLDKIIRTFGYRGCALAAIARSCSRLELQTRHESDSSTYSKVILRGVVGPVEVRSSIRPVPGTTVTVTEMLEAMPVRRKRIKEVFDLDDIIHQLESLAIIYVNVSISVRDDMSGKVLLQTHRQDSCKPTLGQLYGLAENVLLIPISWLNENLEVTGYICRELHSDCSLQHVYVNNRLVHKTPVHKLTIDLLKKYGKFWERDRAESGPVVALDGYIFILKLQMPYQNFYLEYCGRKTSLHLHNAEEVLRGVHKAIKFCLKDMNSSVQGEWMPQLKEEKQEKRSFGPSQLVHAVRGQKAKRPAETEPTVSPTVAHVEHIIDTAQRVDDIVGEVPQTLPLRSPQSIEDLEPRNQPLNQSIVRKKTRNNSNVKPLSLQHTDCRNLKSLASTPLAYPNAYFNQNSGEGTVLAENAPLYEINDFSRMPFHEFLAWLHVKGSYDANARKLFEEFAIQHKASQAPSQVAYCNRPAPLVPLKEIRRERFALWSRETLERIEKTRQKLSKKPRRGIGIYPPEEPRSVTHSVIRRKTTTIFRTPHQLWTNGRAPSSWPQVSFKEFMTWLKCKNRQDNIADLVLDEFYKFKRSCVYLRESENIGNVNVSEMTQKQNVERAKADRPKNVVSTVKEPEMTGCLREKRLDTCNNKLPWRFQQLIDTGPRSPEMLSPISPIPSTWQSHYREKQVHTRKRPFRKDDAAEKVSGKRQRNSSPKTSNFILSNNLHCSDILSDSDKSIIGHRNENSLLPNSLNVDPNLDKSHVPYQRMDTPKSKEVGVQFHTEMIDTSVQVYQLSHKLNKSVQTDCVRRLILKDQATQTAAAAQSEGADHAVSEPVYSSNTQQRSSELPCAQRMSEIPTFNRERCSQKLPLRLEVDEDIRPELLATMPADPLWEKRCDEAGREFYVHSLNGSTSFNPPTTSTRVGFSMQMQSAVGRDLHVHATGSFETATVPPLHQDDLVELQAAIDSCDDYLEKIKWQHCQDGEGDRLGDIFLTELQKSSTRAGVSNELAITTACVPKQEAAIHKMLSSFNFTKIDLNDAEVIGQLDKKFIVVLMKKAHSGPSTTLGPFTTDIICLLDQHAVDERIRLEQLLKKYGAEGVWKSEFVDPPLLLTVKTSTFNIVSGNQNHFSTHGLQLCPSGSQKLIVKAVPACFVRKQLREKIAYRESSMKRLVADLVEELADYSTDTRGASVALPRTVFNVIASEACTSAIKFNRDLELTMMMHLLYELSECQNPFQCAHGRPSLVPLLELKPTNNVFAMPFLVTGVAEDEG